jgi:hypothetical protein
LVPYSREGFGTRVLRRIFGSEREKEMGDGKKLRNKMFPPNIRKIIKLKNVTFERYNMHGGCEMYIKFMSRNIKEFYNILDRNACMRILLRSRLMTVLNFVMIGGIL